MGLKWPGSGSAVSGSTPFGIYDSDSSFQTDAPNMAVWCARRLGYPIQDVELQDIHFYACFEEAVSEYAAQVNQFNIRNNIDVLKGVNISNNPNYSQTEIIGSSLPYMIRLSEEYGTEAGVGGNVSWKTGSISVQSGSQVYDLNTTFAAVSESGNTIEIKRVFNDGTPALTRFFDPFSIAGQGYMNLIDEFGFGGYSPASQFVLMPLYEDMLRIQAIEFNDQIRKSAHSFELINNQLRIFPIPSSNFTLHFQYIVKEDRYNQVVSQSRANVASDYSNMPYQAMTYASINEVGKQWIRKYTLALSKELLGIIREKFQTIPIPGNEISLDGAALRAEAQTEKDQLIEQLRETLEEISTKNQMQYAAEKAEQHQQVLNKIPLQIYVGSLIPWFLLFILI